MGLSVYTFPMTYGAEVLANLSTALDAVEGIAKREPWAFNGATSGVSLTFTNGLGLSVAIGPKSYGGRTGLLETVELDTDGDFIYNRTDGWLEVSDVVAKCQAISAV